MFNIVSQPNSQKARFQCSSIGQFQSSILRCPTTDLKFTVYKSFVDIKRSVIFCSDKLRTNLSTDCVHTSQTHMHYILQPDWSLAVISKLKGIYTVNKICY